MLTAWGFLAFGIVVSVWTRDKTPKGTYAPAVQNGLFRHRTSPIVHEHARACWVAGRGACNLLVRVDAVGACQQIIGRAVLPITSARALGSQSLRCDNATDLCADVVLASKSPSSFSQQQRMVAPVRLGPRHILGYKPKSQPDGEVHVQGRGWS